MCLTYDESEEWVSNNIRKPIILKKNKKAPITLEN
jgi:hypothetical protein